MLFNVITNQLPDFNRDEPLQSMFESCLRAKKKNAAWNFVDCCSTDTLVTLAKGWLCWDDERTVQVFSNGYI